MSAVLVSLGSNQGDRLANLRGAVRRLRSLRATRLGRVSSLYETAPVGTRGVPFLNAAAELRTRLSPMGLLVELKRIEASLGRRPGPRFGPRPADLDIVEWRGRRLRRRHLEVPHPRASSRRFVVEPLGELRVGRPRRPARRLASQKVRLVRTAWLAAPLVLLPWLGAKASDWTRAVERGFVFQYADAFRLQTHYEDPHVGYAFLSPRWTLPLPKAERLFLSVEPRLGWFSKPTKSLIGGASLVLQWKPRAWGGLVPFLEAGAGPLWTESKLLEGFFNWELMLGVGTHLLLSEGTAATFGYRLHHISNAGFYEPNIGINAHMPFLGVTWFK